MLDRKCTMFLCALVLSTAVHADQASDVAAANAMLAKAQLGFRTAILARNTDGLKAAQAEIDAARAAIAKAQTAPSQ